ncbi:hypothetical protein [Undibacterium sp. Ren11W]|uniref:hypothetical protein n=1 Tax=Undibacterium sp. Ren11W TaxID=3413045 RepID=UPI003BF328B1
MRSINIDTSRDENAIGLSLEVNAMTPAPYGNDYLDYPLQKEIALWFKKITHRKIHLLSKSNKSTLRT